jgi:hypothetical protein
MANQEHLDLLKQGSQVWNQWWQEYPNIQPDLSESNHFETDLSRTNLKSVNLERARLGGANLYEANAYEARFSKTDLSGEDLSGADFFEANLSGANFSRANFFATKLNRSILNHSNVSHASIACTSFGDIDLCLVKELESTIHRGPSTIGIDTISRSQCNIPEVFLRGIGVPDLLITYARSLVGQPFDFYSCFISYSNHDQVFAERLYADLQSKGVRCWFAPEDLKIGDHYHQRIDESIRLYDKLILILSEHSLNNIWVKKEVETAFEKEEHNKKLV